jgi:putative molybdopterin biosynthesis protein
MKGVHIQLARIRRERGVAAAELARQAGVTRQTIYAMESGSYVPNTAVALRLARALDVPVEQLFSLAGEPAAAAEQEVDLLYPARVSGAAVQLARVGERLVAAPAIFDPVFLPPADGLLQRYAKRSSRGGVTLTTTPLEETSRLIVAGCDPAISLLARRLLRHGVEIIAAATNSTQALGWLRRGLVHIAGSHLTAARTADANVNAVRRAFPSGGIAVITMAEWEEGIVTAPGNPKKIRSASDLARRGVTLVNREAGSGSRRLLDAELRRAGVPGSAVRGYDVEARGHLLAARAVFEGAADCCIATRAAASAFGLHFIPLRGERYDLAVPERFLGLPAVTRFFEMLARAEVRRELEALARYEVRRTGERVM